MHKVSKESRCLDVQGARLESGKPFGNQMLPLHPPCPKSASCTPTPPPAPRAWRSSPTQGSGKGSTPQITSFHKGLGYIGLLCVSSQEGLPFCLGAPTAPIPNLAGASRSFPSQLGPQPRESAQAMQPGGLPPMFWAHGTSVPFPVEQRAGQHLFRMGSVPQSP